MTLSISNDLGQVRVSHRRQTSPEGWLTGKVEYRWDYIGLGFVNPDGAGWFGSAEEAKQDAAKALKRASGEHVSLE